MATTKTKTTAGAATANRENGFDEDHDQSTTDAAKQAESEQSNEELEASQVEGKEHHHIMAVEPKAEEEEVTQIDPQLSPIIRYIAQEEKDMETACPEKESRSEEGQQSAVTQEQDFPEKISSQEEVQKMPQEKAVVKFEEDGNNTEGGDHSEIAQPQELHEDGKTTQLVDASIPGYTAETKEDIRIKEESDEEDTIHQASTHKEATSTDPAVASETTAAATTENLNAIEAEEIFFDAQQQQQEEETKEHTDDNDNASFKDAPDVEMENDTRLNCNSKFDCEQDEEKKDKLGNAVTDHKKQKDTTNEDANKKLEEEEAAKTINNNATKEVNARSPSAFDKDEKNKARLLYSHASQKYRYWLKEVSRLEKSLKTAKEELADSKDTLEDVIDQHMEALRSFTPADTHIESNDVDEEWNKMYHLLAKYKTEHGHLPSWKEIYSSEQKAVEHEKKKDEQPNRKGEEQKGNEGEQHTRTEVKDDNTKGEQDPTKKDDATKQDNKENGNDKEEEEEEHLKSKEEVEVEPNDDKQEVMEDKLEVTVYKQEVMDNKQEVTEDYQKVTEDYQKVTDNKQEVTEDKQEVTEDKQEVTEDKQEVTEDKHGVTKEKQEMMQDRQDNIPAEENDNTRKTNEFDKKQDEQQEESSQKKKKVDGQQPKEIEQQPNEESAQEKRDGEEQTMEVEHQKGEGMQQTREKEKDDDKTEKIINGNKEGNKTSEQENEEVQRKLLEVEQEINGDEKALKAVEQDEKSSGGSKEDVEIAENKNIRKEQRQQSDQHGKRALMIWMMDQRNKYEDCLKHPLKFGMDYYKMKSLQDVGLLTEIVNRWKGKCPLEADGNTEDNEEAGSNIIISEKSSEWKASNDTNYHESRKEEAADGERNVSNNVKRNSPTSASTREQKKHGCSHVNVGTSTPSKRAKVSTPPYPVSPYPSYPTTASAAYSFPSHLPYYQNATSGGYRLGGVGNIFSTGYYGGNGFDYQGMISSPLTPRQQQQWYDYNQRSMYIQQQQQQEIWALGQSLAPHSQSQWDSYNVATPSSPNVGRARSGNGTSTFSSYSSYVKDGTTSPSMKQTQEGVASKHGRGQPRKYPVTSETPILPSTPIAAASNFDKTNESAGKSSHRTAVV